MTFVKACMSIFLERSFVFVIRFFWIPFAVGTQYKHWGSRVAIQADVSTAQKETQCSRAVYFDEDADSDEDEWQEDNFDGTYQ